jgi:hypothetical protein
MGVGKGYIHMFFFTALISATAGSNLKKFQGETGSGWAGK